MLVDLHKVTSLSGCSRSTRLELRCNVGIVSSYLMGSLNSVGGSIISSFSSSKSNFSTIFDGFSLWKKLGSSYSKIFQLKILVSKLDFRDLKLKID